MKRCLGFFATFAILLMAGGLLISPLLRAAGARQKGTPAAPARMSAAAQRQIKSLLDEKKARTPAQKKLDSQLLYTMKARRGEPMTPGGEVRSLRLPEEAVNTDRVLVDIKGTPGKELIAAIARGGGTVVSSDMRAGAARAQIPFDALEEFAEAPSVRSIRPAAIALTQHQLAEARGIGLNPRGAGLPPDFQQRATNIRTQLSAALTGTRQQSPLANTGSVISEGDTAMRVEEARNFFGVSGAGVKVGVLSAGVLLLQKSIASGDLPPDVTVLPGQEGPVNNPEGTAMLEIIHDLAPGAKLYFATATTSIESFAANIRALRAAGCDIIVDDVIYTSESPFQDDILAQAVEDVVADGALYFSAAGNFGNFNDGTAGTWEGDFKDSGITLPALPGGTLHDFGDGVVSNTIELSRFPFILGLWWSDPLGASGNDYDIFIMDEALTTVVAASTNIQDGDDDPIEFLASVVPGYRIVVFKAEGAQRRALHLDSFGGRLGIRTAGESHGHSTVAGALSVAAINVALAGGGNFTGGPARQMEISGSDGFRRVFFRADGTPITPGNFLFSSKGGEVRKKPDLTAVDGVSTSIIGYSPFFGTSAAAPHAAAIAALLKEAGPRLPQTRIRNALTKTAIDIEAKGFDRDSGAGVIDAFAALSFINAAPSPLLEPGAVATTDVGGNGDGTIDPGETGALSVTLTNLGGATAVDVSATLTSTTPGVTIVSATSVYPSIGSNGQSAVNTTPFIFRLDPGVICGEEFDVTLKVNYSNSNEGPLVTNLRVGTASPNLPRRSATVSYTGPPVVIPVDAAGTFTIPIEVSGLSGALADLNFSIDGSSCTADFGADTVGLDHSYVGDLIIKLTSPQGTTVTLINQAGGEANSGHNFCQTMLDDSAAASIQDVLATDAPFTGTFKPASPLAAFNGQNANGTWILSVTDVFPFDGGNVRAFSLHLTTYSGCNGP